MATLRTVLDDASRKEFESPPIFSILQRRSFFTLPFWANSIVKELNESNNEVMFTLSPNLYPQDRYVSLFEAVQTVNQVCNFTLALSSIKLQHIRVQPDERLFFAALVAFGCNLGLGCNSLIGTKIT